MSADSPSTWTGKADIKDRLARSFFVLPGHERFTSGIARLEPPEEKRKPISPVAANSAQ